MNYNTTSHRPLLNLLCLAVPLWMSPRLAAAELITSVDLVQSDLEAKGEVKVESRAAEIRRRFDVDPEGPNHRVVDISNFRTNELGEVTGYTNKIVQMADGLNYWNDNKWTESKAEFDLKDGYASAERTRHKVNIGGNLNVRGVLAVRMPDNQSFRATVHGLAYYDRSTGNSVLLAPVTDSQGYRISPNQILFKNAFDGVEADVRYTLSINGLGQDVVVRGALPDPEKYGMNLATTMLEVWTETFDAPEPSIQKVPLSAKDEDKDDDSYINFGGMVIRPGNSFRDNRDKAPNPLGLRPVKKHWAKIGERSFLVESIERTAVLDIMTNLPAFSPDGARTYPVRPSRNGALAELPLKKEIAITSPVIDASTDPATLASVTHHQDGIVIDFEMAASSSMTGYTFKSTETYHILGRVTFGEPNIPGAPVNFEPGTVLKFARYQGAIEPVVDTYGDVNCQGEMYRPIIFTAEDDHSVGEKITTVATMTGYYGLYGLILRAYNVPTRVFNINWARFNRFWSSIGLRCSTQHTVKNTQILNCNYGFDISGYGDVITSANLQNVLVADVQGAFYTYTPTTTSVSCEHVTVDKAVDWLGYNFLPTFKNCLIVGAPQGSIGMAKGTSEAVSFGKLTQTEIETVSTGVFATVGQGKRYLPARSRHINAGVASINPRLAAELRELTTDAPVPLTGSINVTSTLAPRAMRDTDTPDRGYHYAPLDYYIPAPISIGSAVVLKLSDGVTIAGVPSILSDPSIFKLTGSASLTGSGQANRMNHLTTYQTVQEGDGGPAMGGVRMFSGGTISLKFTEISMPASLKVNRQLFNVSVDNSISLRDCQLKGLFINAVNGPSTTGQLNLRNCLFEGCEFEVTQGYNGGPNYKLDFELSNCLLASGCDVQFKKGLGGAAYGYWKIFNNLFANSTGTMNLLSGTFAAAPNELFTKNAYTAAAAMAGDSGSLVGILPSFVTGPLGKYYYPHAPTTVNTLGSLVDAGYSGSGTTPGTLGLYHHTVLLNGTKEGGGAVADIGFHYVATDSQLASTGYSITTQGANGWSYNYGPQLGLPSLGSQMTFDPTPTVYFWVKPGANTYCWIWSGGMHPGDSNDSIRSFSPPRTGRVAVYALVSDNHFQNPVTTADGVQARVLFGDNVVVPWKVVGETVQNVPVAGAGVALAGEQIHFQLNMRSNNAYDSTIWDPRILYDTPLDSDGDGLPDYIEDANGDGSPSGDVSNYTTYTSPNQVQVGTPVLFTPAK